MGEGKAKGFREDEHDTLWFEGPNLCAEQFGGQEVDTSGGP